jgi:hypothetical protein
MRTFKGVPGEGYDGCADHRYDSHMHEQGVGAGEREIPVKDRTRGRTQGGAYVERSTEEYHDRLVEADPEPSPQIWRANAIERSNVRASFICRRESLIVLFSAIHHRASEMIDSAFAAFFRLPNSMR